MSSQNESVQNTASEAVQSEAVQTDKVKLNGIFAFKLGMSTIFENGEAIPVTILKQDNWTVTQVKTDEKDGYSAVQISCGKKSLKNTGNAEKGHNKRAGLDHGVYHSREIRQASVEGIQIGQAVAIDSLQKGDVIKITARSKGRGFQGSVKRWNFGGGPSAHGSKFHRQPGSAGNRTWPGRIMPGKKYPGHMGDRQITVHGVRIVDVIPEENVIIVKGAVPGAANGLVRLMKE